MGRMVVINKHSAEAAGIAPGAVGTVDEHNPGVRVLLQAGLLKPTTAHTRVGGSYPSADELEAMARQNADLADQLKQVSEKLVAKEGECADLAAQLASARESADADSIVPHLREALADAEQAARERDAQIASLRAHVAELEKALEAATAPSAPATPAAPPAEPQTQVDPPPKASKK